MFRTTFQNFVKHMFYYLTGKKITTENKFTGIYNGDM